MARAGKYEMTKTNIAKIYIRENIFKKSKKEILSHLVEKTGLRYRSLEKYYSDIKIELEVIVENEVKNTMRREKEFTNYKGKPRQFFRFDDSKLNKD